MYLSSLKQVRQQHKLRK